MKNINKDWGWSIPDTLLERTDLDMYEKVLIAIMGRLGALEKSIYPRQKWLAGKMGLTERGVRNILKRLENKGIVKYEGRKWKIAQYSLTYSHHRNSVPVITGTAFRSSPEQRSSHKKDIQSKDIQTKVSTIVDTGKPCEYGDPDINFLISSLKEKLQLKILDGTLKRNRQYCYLALKKFKGRKNVELIIGAAASDDFWRNKITSFTDIYYKGVKIVGNLRAKQNSYAEYNSDN